MMNFVLSVKTKDEVEKIGEYHGGAIELKVPNKVDCKMKVLVGVL